MSYYREVIAMSYQFWAKEHSTASRFKIGLSYSFIWELHRWRFYGKLLPRYILSVAGILLRLGTYENFYMNQAAGR
jgi:hypothetical protein